METENPMKQITQRSNFRVYLSKNQISLFERTAGCARFIWNKRVESFNSQEKSKDLSIREWSCPDCGSHHDRDVNAAKNVLQRGIFEELQMGSCKTYLKKSDVEGEENDVLLPC